eukprot:PhF_6_TR25523/c0_g1_i3/m.35706
MLSEGDASAASSAYSDMICRVCREGPLLEPLLRPCKCNGTIAYAHESCMLRWISQKQELHCELCKTSFRISKLYSHKVDAVASTKAIFVYIRDIAQKYVLYGIRIILVVIVWALMVPWCLARIIKFHLSYMKEWEGFGLLVLPTSVPWHEGLVHVSGGALAMLCLGGLLVAVSGWREWCVSHVDQFRELAEAIEMRDAVLGMNHPAPPPPPPTAADVPVVEDEVVPPPRPPAPLPTPHPDNVEHNDDGDLVGGEEGGEEILVVGGGGVGGHAMGPVQLPRVVVMAQPPPPVFAPIPPPPPPQAPAPPVVDETAAVNQTNNTTAQHIVADETTLQNVLGILQQRGHALGGGGDNNNRNNNDTLLDMIGLTGSITLLWASACFMVIFGYLVVALCVFMPFKFYSFIQYGPHWRIPSSQPQPSESRISLMFRGQAILIVLFYSFVKVLRALLVKIHRSPTYVSNAKTTLGMIHATACESLVWLTYIWGFVKIAINIGLDFVICPITFGMIATVVGHGYFALGSRGQDLVPQDVSLWVESPTSLSVTQAIATTEVIVRHALRPTECIVNMKDSLTLDVFQSVYSTVLPHVQPVLTDVVLWIIGMAILHTIVFLVLSLQGVLREDLFFFPHIPRQLNVVSFMLKCSLSRRVIQFVRKVCFVTIAILFVLRLGLKLAMAWKKSMFPMIVDSSDVLRLLSDGLLVNSTVLIVDHTLKVSSLLKSFFLLVSEPLGVTKYVIARRGGGGDNNNNNIDLDAHDTMLKVKLWIVFISFVGALIVSVAIGLWLPRELGVLTYRTAFYYETVLDEVVPVFAVSSSLSSSASAHVVENTTTIATTITNTTLNTTSSALPPFVLTTAMKERRLQVYFMGVWATVVLVVSLCFSVPPVWAKVKVWWRAYQAQRRKVKLNAARQQQQHHDQQQHHHNNKHDEDDEDAPLQFPSQSRHRILLRTLKSLFQQCILFIQCIPLTKERAQALLFGGVSLVLFVPTMAGVWLEYTLLTPIFCRAHQQAEWHFLNAWTLGVLYLHI